MSNLQLTWTADELLATHDVDEPMIANGVRCHGGFLADGSYVPPRTKNRVPAIDAWQQSHREQFGTDILDAPLDLWPAVYPNVAQTKYLLHESVRQPVITQLTRIGTVEGFGAMIRHAQLGNAQRFFDESIAGTAIAHLNKGLFEAHARDEAGWDQEAGHNQMWFAARDVAFGAPPTEDETQTMLTRMGIVQPDGTPPTPEQMRAAAEAMRRFSDLDLQLEMTIRRMLGILFIEVSAFHTFAWAEDVLSDDGLVADAGKAAQLVRSIRADETPHVEYLRTALTEMRDRTFIGESGRKIAGTEVIGTLWDAGLAESLGPRREQFVKTVDGELAHALGSHPRRDEILAGFHARLDPGRGGMKFGVFYEHQLPRPWTQESEYQLIQDALEQIAYADSIGIEYAWEVEHHFLEEYSHSSAPEVFLAAASQRTKNIRLGHGIVQTPPPFNHPARIAERIAMLDLVSDGRADFGSGESSSEAELGGFMIEPEKKRAMWEEGLRVAIRCMTEEPFTGHSGEFVTMPPRNVLPKPRQKPHPPVWVACSRRDTIHLAAQKAIGALAFAFVDPEEAKYWVDDYYNTLAKQGVPIGDAVNANVACVTTFMCHPDEDEAIRRGLEGANFFGYSLAHYYVFGRHHPAQTNVWEEFQQRRAEHGYDPEAVIAASENADRLGAKVVEEGIGGLRGAVGTPEQLREYLRRYEECGVDQVIFCYQAGKNRHDHIMEALELFGRDVLPEFKERDEKLTRDKAQRLAPVIDEVMARKPAEDHPPLPADDYAFPAIPRAMADRFGNDQFHQMLDQFAEQSAIGPGGIENLINSR